MRTWPLGRLKIALALAVGALVRISVASWLRAYLHPIVVTSASLRLVDRYYEGPTVTQTETSESAAARHTGDRR